MTFPGADVDGHAGIGPNLTGGPNAWSATEARPVGDLSWQDDAACRGTDPNLFNPPPQDNRAAEWAAAAKAVCARCPVRTACADHAITQREPAGIWGGLTARERKEIRAGGAETTSCPVCGRGFATVQALASHRRSHRTEGAA